MARRRNATQTLVDERLAAAEQTYRVMVAKCAARRLPLEPVFGCRGMSILELVPVAQLLGRNLVEDLREAERQAAKAAA